MRQLELNILDPESVRQLSTGQRVQLVLDDIAVAEIVPVDLAALAEEQRRKEQTRANARADLLEIMHGGINMEGFKITSRDELYDRA